MNEGSAFGLGLTVAFSAMLAPLTLALSQLPLPVLYYQIRLLGLISLPVALFLAVQGRREGVIGTGHLIGSAVVLVAAWGSVLLEIHRLTL
jgi:hypothetical protein